MEHFGFFNATSLEARKVGKKRNVDIRERQINIYEEPIVSEESDKITGRPESATKYPKHSLRNMRVYQFRERPGEPPQLRGHEEAQMQIQGGLESTIPLMRMQ